MRAVFAEEKICILKSKGDRIFSGGKVTRIGIVQVSHDGKLHFLHRTFAEYYVADCLVNRLTEGNNTSEQVQALILKDIFLENVQ